MSSTSSLQTIANPTLEEVAVLERMVDERERDLLSVKTQLQQLQVRYLSELGALYAELTALDEELAQAEIKAGLRVPDEPGLDEPDEPETSGSGGCSSTSAPSSALKAMFRARLGPRMSTTSPNRGLRRSAISTRRIRG